MLYPAINLFVSPNPLELLYYMKLSMSIFFCLRCSISNSRRFAGIVDISPHHNPKNKELSYQFLSSLWGKGYAYEVTNSVLQYCINVLDIHFLVSETQTANVKSCRLLEKLGFKQSEKIIRFGSEQSIYVIDLLSRIKSE